jgi:glycogen synthase
VNAFASPGQPNAPLAPDAAVTVPEPGALHVAGVPKLSEGLRLLVVTPRFWPLMGGVENHVYETTRRLAEWGVAVTVLTTDPLRTLPREEMANGVRILRVPAWPAKRDWYFAPGLIPFITHGGWDVVHIQSYHTLVAPIAMAAALRAGLPYVVTFHGGGHSSWLRNAIRAPQQAALRPLLAKAARLVAVARFEIAYYGRRLRLPESHFALIPNGSDLPRLARSQEGSGHKSVIASVGRLERYKGHQRVIAAMPRVLHERPDVRLWIAGVGPYREALQAQVAGLGLSEKVEIRAIPPSARQQMAEELAGTSLVVLMSEYETHPITVMEALALGRPVLVADTSGLSELAERGWATAIPLNSTPQIVGDAILDQLRQPLLPPPLQLPTWDDCAAGLLALYRSVAKVPPGDRC